MEWAAMLLGHTGQSKLGMFCLGRHLTNITPGISEKDHGFLQFPWIEAYGLDGNKRKSQEKRKKMTTLM